MVERFVYTEVVGGSNPSLRIFSPSLGVSPEHKKAGAELRIVAQDPA